jgi:putative ABC transport system permease protein
VTAIRYPVPANSFASVYREAVYRNVVANLDPAEFALRFEPVREQALKAAQQSQDFGQLFLGFSIFLVASALLLMAMLFQFGLEQRATEIGTLLALGFTPKQLRRLLLAEGVVLAMCGGALGAFGGLLYAKAMLWALTTVWRSAVSTEALSFHASAPTLITGFAAGTLVAAAAIWLALRKQARQPVASLLAGELQTRAQRRTRARPWIGLLCGTGAIAIVAWTLFRGDTANAGAFFGAGAMLLISGLSLTSAWLKALARRSSRAKLTLGSLGVRACARRRSRSLATVALLASGCFLIVAIGVFRLDANRHADRRSSGTGGYALIGESTLPIVPDLNTRAGRESFGLSESDLQGVQVVPFRLREGDDASCLNLNRAQKPRLLGVRPELLAGRFAFAKVAKGYDRSEGWRILRTIPAITRPAPLAAEENAIPAIGDANSIQWALGMKLGDTLDYTDEQGRTFKLRLVGAVANSILQGSLVIDEGEFVKKFPNESGYRFFLLDAPTNAMSQVSAALSRALQDSGLELTPAAQRLNAFNAVQNTYLGTFQILGGLGLLLGSAGLGVVVLRNVLERRGELGLLTAVGFRRRTVQRLLLSEHSVLLELGLALGVVAATVAVLPSVLTPGAGLPYLSLGLTLAGVLLNGFLWTFLATWYSLKGNLLEALRNE